MPPASPSPSCTSASTPPARACGSACAKPDHPPNPMLSSPSPRRAQLLEISDFVTGTRSPSRPRGAASSSRAPTRSGRPPTPRGDRLSRWITRSHTPPSSPPLNERPVGRSLRAKVSPAGCGSPRGRAHRSRHDPGRLRATAPQAAHRVRLNPAARRHAARPPTVPLNPHPSASQRELSPSRGLDLAA